MNDNTCRIPVKATYRRVNGEMVMVAAEWAEIPAEKIAKFLIEHSGKEFFTE